MKVIAMNDSRDFQDAESVRSGQSHASQTVFSPLFQDPGGMPCRSLGMPSRKNGPPSIWDTHGKSGNVLANPTASSSAPYPQGINLWISSVSEHTSPHVMSESQTPAFDPRCQSGPSARSHSSLVREIFQRILGQTNNDCRFQILMLTNSLHQPEAMHWIKEVEMVDSVDDLMSSCSVRGIQMLRRLLQH